MATESGSDQGMSKASTTSFIVEVEGKVQEANNIVLLPVAIEEQSTSLDPVQSLIDAVQELIQSHDDSNKTQ